MTVFPFTSSVYFEVNVTSLPANCLGQNGHFHGEQRSTSVEPVPVKYNDSIIVYAVVVHHEQVS